ncbi:MAG: undecaprenyl-diphosphate phosphatase [Gemmatimonadaceae bacterium]|nr:undecaprenyl-diphosphate phosphatase [Gemmatimonadaceae bacterium]
MHFGTLLALIWYFRREWMEMLASVGQIVRTCRVVTIHEKRALYLVVATIPGGIGGLLLNDYAENHLPLLALIATTLAVMGVVLWAVDRWSVRARAIEDVTLRDAILIGLAQVLALVPGVSRSGSTITAAAPCTSIAPARRVSVSLIACRSRSPPWSSRCQRPCAPRGCQHR